MTWKDKQSELENLENYQNYLISNELKGQMCPTTEQVIKMINSKRKVQL